MIERLRTWFNGRSLRERRLLLIMAALLVLTIIWAGIIRPIGDGLSSSRERHSNAVLALADTQARLATLKSLNANRPAPLGQPLDAYIRQSANNAGFEPSNVSAQGNDRVQISIATARSGALLAWLADLDAAGVIVTNINITNNGDQTVSAQMSLMTRGV